MKVNKKEEHEKDEGKIPFILICYMCGKKRHVKPKSLLAKKENHKKNLKNPKRERKLTSHGRIEIWNSQMMKKKPTFISYQIIKMMR